MVGEKEYPGTVIPWEIEVAGYKRDGTLVVFECRKRGRNVEKDEMASFAYTIEDLGAEKYVIFQKKFSKGAQKIADHHKINHIQLQLDEKTEQMLIGFLGRCFATVTVKTFSTGTVPSVSS